MGYHHFRCINGHYWRVKAGGVSKISHCPVCGTAEIFKSNVQDYKDYCTKRTKIEKAEV